MPDSPLINLPDAAIGNDYAAFLEVLHPEERIRVTIYTLKLLSHVRCSNADDGDMLRACAKIEALANSAFSPMIARPQPQVAYGTPPPTTPQR